MVLRPLASPAISCHRIVILLALRSTCTCVFISVRNKKRTRDGPHSSSKHTMLARKRGTCRQIVTLVIRSTARNRGQTDAGLPVDFISGPQLQLWLTARLRAQRQGQQE